MCTSPTGLAATILALAAAGALVFSGCTPDAIATPADAPVDPAGSATTAALMVYPVDDPTSPQKVELGRLLFWDPLLSGDRDIACATCHHPDYAYTDGRKLSVGTGGIGLGPSRLAGRPAHATTRNSMTVLNAAWNGRTLAAIPPAETAPMFWDNRVSSLETQARGPTSALAEMMGTWFDAATIFPEIVARLGAIPEYVDLFDGVFGEGGMTDENVMRAIATFERTLVDHGSSYDRFADGNAAALTTPQAHGFAVFNRSHCNGCHAGPMFSDFQTHRIAARAGGDARVPDDGAGNGRFRTASLRNVARTAPYMHDGAFDTLEQVLDLYRRVDDNDDAKLRALDVPNGSDRDDLIAFLHALSDGDYDRTVPARVPSGLAVGGAIH